MPKTFNRALKKGYESKTIGAVTVNVTEFDPSGFIKEAFGTTVPTAASAGFAKGALFVDTDVATGISGLYENIGTTSSSNFNIIGAVSVGEIALTTGSILIGAAGVGSALDVKTSGQILVGNGTTGVSVAVSGDATLASSGALTVVGATGAFNVGTNVTLAKEVNHTVSVTTTTTANTAGGNLTVSAATAQGTGTGGVMLVTGGDSGAGATGNGGPGGIRGGAATSTNGTGGAAVVTGGVGTGTGLGGAATITGGVGGATAVGGAASLVGGAGGSSSGTGGNALVTGGAGSAGNANGGDVIITGGALNGSGRPGFIYLRSTTANLQGAAVAKTTSSTMTAADFSTGIITINQGGGASSAQQLPTASDMDTALPNFTTNDSFDFVVINTSTVDAEDASVTTNTGWTLVGNMDFQAHSALAAQGSSGILRLRKTGSAAWTAYRIS